MSLCGVETGSTRDSYDGNDPFAFGGSSRTNPGRKVLNKKLLLHERSLVS